MAPLPKYRFDSSKTIIAKVDDCSTVRFDLNNYSVPVKYAGEIKTLPAPVGRARGDKPILSSFGLFF
jgi:hypothetical protein